MASQLGYMSEKRLTVLSNKGFLGFDATGRMGFYEACVKGK